MPMPLNLDTDIIVRFRAEYFHYWSNAIEPFSYLSRLHRHEIHFQVTMTQRADRDVEFIEFKRKLVAAFHEMRSGEYIRYDDEHATFFRQVEVGQASMETVATCIVLWIIEQYGDRFITVSALEDGENGAIVTNLPVPPSKRPIKSERQVAKMFDFSTEPEHIDEVPVEELNTLLDLGVRP